MQLRRFIGREETEDDAHRSCCAEGQACCEEGKACCGNDDDDKQAAVSAACCAELAACCESAEACCHNTHVAVVDQGK